MKFILILLAFLPVVVFGQGTINGRVIDSKTFKALPYATVYLNQTTIGTSTNDKGEFKLHPVKPGVYDLVVSYIGYQAFQTKVNVNDSIPLTLSIKLQPSVTDLKEVLVKGKKDSRWLALYEKFKTQFFGISPYTRQCTISNPWVLELTQDASGALKATASLPLQIENPGLGYSITCQLKDFVSDAGTYLINGTFQFTEAQTLDSALNVMWHKRRQEVYQGSLRHLMTAIVEGRAEEEGFQLYLDKSSGNDVVRKSNFLENLNVVLVGIISKGIAIPTEVPNQSRLTMPTRVEVHFVNKVIPPKVYRNVSHPVSWIETSRPFEATSEGIIIQPNRVTVAGAMSDPRIAELLPLDFVPDAPVPSTTVKRKVFSKLAALVEKTYTITDKPYYYPSEAIFFKTFVNYMVPVYRDSLSRVLHAELVDVNGRVVQDKIYPIDRGSSVGDFSIPHTMEPGDYVLRTYTRWMLNYHPDLVFEKPIKIMARDQRARSAAIPVAAHNASVQSDKEEYQAREKIDLSLEAKDIYGNPVSTNWCITVTDLEETAIPKNEKTILNSFAIPSELLPDTSMKVAPHTIQMGIDFMGKVTIGKKKNPAQSVLTVYQTNHSDVFGIPTNETGEFYAQLQVMDSTELLIDVKTIQRKLGQLEVLPTDDPQPPVRPVDPIQVDVYQTEDATKYHVVDLITSARMLEGVSVEATRIERVPAARKSVLSDSHIDGDALRATNAVDLLSALRGRIPGLQILYFKDPESQNPLRYLTFSGGFASITGNIIQECLVEIDGVPLTAQSDETVAEKLATMSVNDVESIDASRFAAASVFGARAGNGVISIKTRMGSNKAVQVSDLNRSKLRSVRLRGYSEAAEFESPDYSDASTSDDRADYRSTIYWNPRVFSEGQDPALVTFYAADLPTQYRIVAEGVTADGEAVRAEKVITIVPKKN